MKKMHGEIKREGNTFVLYIGTAREIKSLYDNFMKRNLWYSIHRNVNEVVDPVYNYGLCCNCSTKIMQICNADEVLHLLNDFEIK